MNVMRDQIFHILMAIGYPEPEKMSPGLPMRFCNVRRSKHLVLVRDALDTFRRHLKGILFRHAFLVKCRQAAGVARSQTADKKDGNGTRTRARGNTMSVCSRRGHSEASYNNMTSARMT